MEITRRTMLGAAGLSALALALPAFGGAAFADEGRVGRGSDKGKGDGGRRASGLLYVNDNTAGGNTVAGFARHADGTLTPLPGSPFAIGGAGTGGTVGSQGAVQLAYGGRYLLVADAGSNTISVLRVRPDGAPRPVEGSPIASGGTMPVSIAVHRGLVYVANAGSGGANYTGFTLNPGGQLRPLPNSTFPLPDAAPGDILFSGDGRILAGMRVGPSQIDSFVVGADGRLTPAPNSPIAAQSLGPFGSAFRPTNPRQLFVSNAHAGPGAGAVSAFQVANNATLTPIGASPFADNQTAPCWVAITPDGQALFAANTGSDSISSYRINADGTLTLLGSTTLKGAPGMKLFELRVDPSGRYLYALESNNNAVATLAISNGALAELATSPTPLPAGATAFGMAVR